MLKIKTGFATLIAALCATAGGVWVAYYNSKEQRDFERQQFQSTLIEHSINFNDYKQSRANLKFLIDVGLIAENNEKINRFIRDTSVHFGRPIDRLPIAPPSPAKPYRVGQFSEELLTGTIVDGLTKRPIEGASVIVKSFFIRYTGRPEPPTPEAEKMVTGRDGKYQVHKTWGYYTLIIQRNGYVTQYHNSYLDGLPDEQLIEMSRKQGNEAPSFLKRIFGW